MTEMTVTLDGDRMWLDYRDKLHRDDGPAYESRDGLKMWFFHGQVMMMDNTLLEWSSGNHNHVPGNAALALSSLQAWR